MVPCRRQYVHMGYWKRVVDEESDHQKRAIGIGQHPTSFCFFSEATENQAVCDL